MNRLLVICVFLGIGIGWVCAQNDSVVMTRPDLTGEFGYTVPVIHRESVSPDSVSIHSVGQPTVGDGQQSDGSGLTGPDLSGEFSDSSISWIFAPRVFKGYRSLLRPEKYTEFPDKTILKEVAEKVWHNSYGPVVLPEDVSDPETFRDSDLFATPQVYLEEEQVPDREELSVIFGSVIPEWLSKAIDISRFRNDFLYSMMIAHPETIEYAYWDLPEQPVIKKDEKASFINFIRTLSLPNLTPESNITVQNDIDRINWLHTFNIGLQLSQAFVSENWYQGGNSHLSFLANFLWDVLLNNVYHPKVIFQSTISYKLNINSTPDDLYHKYTVSQDLFQYNLKAGYKAVHNWYYSLLMQFKTQFLNSYPANSLTRASSFLSPGELNLGAGLTFSKENKAKTLRFSASLSPASYNLKTCIDPNVDHAQFGIRPDRRWVNDFGSNAEVNFYAKMFGNTTYTTRLFLFSDYKTFQTDWENTLNFQFSRLFSTQVYAHFRYDTSTDSSISRHWRKLMLNEILSVGISYTFTTK